jgi:hypothetical protein
MAKQEAPENLRAAIVWFLKTHGDIEETTGRAQTPLRNGVAEQYGFTPSNGMFGLAVRNLEAEGRIAREMQSTRVFAIRLVDGVGEYEEPAVTEETSGAPLSPGVAKKVEKIILEIDKLPLPEKLMLVGQIADSCAGEVDETYAKLRSVLGNI